ncbi:hypothetical protein ABH945_005802 [Paraburkholderia sp. GAS333]|uniref:hypothetical protein n=1 Tax=Paraburkholderia sp. GAS333 TaxID=3156279 RepID=UPI003D1F0937
MNMPQTRRIEIVRSAIDAPGKLVRLDYRDCSLLRMSLNNNNAMSPITKIENHGSGCAGVGGAGTFNMNAVYAPDRSRPVASAMPQRPKRLPLVGVAVIIASHLTL